MRSKFPFDRGACAGGSSGNASEPEFDPESNLKSQTFDIEFVFQLKAYGKDD